MQRREKMASSGPLGAIAPTRIAGARASTRIGAIRVIFAASCLCAGLLGLTGCDGREEPDAYGNFEATEVLVSSEVGGQLVRFEAREGDRLSAGSIVGQVDTISLALQRRELRSQLNAAGTRVSEAASQVEALRAELETAREDYERTLRLFRAEAATADQLNRTRGAVRVLERRIEAARARLGSIREETGAVEARLDQVEERIRKSRITSPISGTVLATYAEAGEFVGPGQPLYRIAGLDTLVLRAYVSGAQLADVRIGQRVRVRIDLGEDELRTFPGVVSWIASEAQFTPTPIQTRDERTELVYAIKVRVPNPDGILKIGMPGDLELPDREPGQGEMAVLRDAGAR